MAFAQGDVEQVSRHDIPRSVLAESQARFAAPAHPGRMLHLSTRLSLSRGDMHRFHASAQGEREVLSTQIMLNFPGLG